MESIQTIIKTLLKNSSSIKSKSQAKQIHAQIVKSFPIFTSDLLSIYSKLNLLPESVFLFNTLPSPPILAWKSIIKCYSSNSYFLESLNCFVKMRGLGMYPDHNVFPSVLKSCTHLMCFDFGLSVHACIIRVGLEFDLFTGNSLLSMYSKLEQSIALEVFDKSPERKEFYQNESTFVVNKNYNNKNNSYHKVSQNCKKLSNLNPMWEEGKKGIVQLASVRKVFETMPQRDVVSYNTLILGYAQSNMYDEATLIIREMGNDNLKPDAFTLSNIFPIIAEYMDVWKAKEIHGYGFRHGFERNKFLASGLTDLYVNCNMVKDAYKLFSSLPNKDYVSWCSIIAACVQNDLFDEGLYLFRQMLSAKVKPVAISCSSIIPACAHLTALPLGQQLHAFIIRAHFDDNMFIASSLVDMYTKCGNIKLAKWIFDNIKQHDLVSWTAMIMGCAYHGHAHDAISLFEQMEEGFTPNSVAFVAVLTACSHAGMVDEGLRFFNRMVRYYNIKPDLEHYSCMVDLFGRAGKLEEAFRFIYNTSENKTTSIWLPLLAACRLHKNVELAEKVAVHINEFDDEDSGVNVLLSNMYSSVGRYKDGAKVRSMLSKNTTRKEPACSWISIGNKVHAFIAGDESHPYNDVIIIALDNLLEQMQMEGCFIDYDSSLPG